MKSGDSELSRLNPRRLLVRGVNWLGDAVMTTPALLRLRERFPDAHIALLTPEKIRDLWMRHPAINEVLAIKHGEGLLSVSGKLRAGRFDLALVLPNSPRSALEVWRAGIPTRVGYARPWRNLFLTHALSARPGHVPMRKRSEAEIRRLTDTNTNRPAEPVGQAASGAPAAQTDISHHIHDYLHLAAALGATPDPLPPQLVVSAEDIAVTKRKFGLDHISHPIFGLIPGAEYGPAKRWPPERFVEAAARVQQRIPCSWMIFGGPEDATVAEKIAAEIRYETERPPVTCTVPDKEVVLNLTGQTSLLELMALLMSCRVLLTNDTGPMHVAAALGTPVVAPFGSTSPALTGPGLPADTRHRLLRSDAPCSPCFLRECPIDFRCMGGISVERVVEAVVEVRNR